MEGHIYHFDLELVLLVEYLRGKPMQVSITEGKFQVNPRHKINPSSGEAYSGEGLGTYGKKKNPTF